MHISIYSELGVARMVLTTPLSMKKITILGTTGSGKTTFLQALFGDFERNDVARRIFREVGSNLDFTPLRYNNFTSSTTTISLNVVNSVIILTRFNKIIVKKYEDYESFDFESIDSAFQVIFNDPAGQDRFDFMQDIAIKGADLVVIMADGKGTRMMSDIPKVIHTIAGETLLNHIINTSTQRKAYLLPSIKTARTWQT